MGKAVNRNFAGSVLAEGGRITPLMIDARDSAGLGLCNPSIFIDNGEPWCILRNVNYTLYHCENEQTFNNRWGPLSYLNPENDIHLRTWNFLCKLTPNLEVERYWKIDTSAFDKEPLWEFVGLEDARLVRWDGHLYGIGVRRDTTTNGQGRMEFSELELGENSVKEIGRYRIEHPLDPNWYTEKNWMPVLDKPYHFIQWTNPPIVVKADLATLTSQHAHAPNEADKIDGLPFLRGGSQVIPWRGLYVCVVHECDLVHNKQGQKDATYLHRFIVYDRDWNTVRIGEPFSFLDGEVEFCCGLAEWQGDFLLSFGFQDNCAFALRVPEAMIPKVLGVAGHRLAKREKWRATQYPTLEVTTAVPAKGCPMECAFCPQDRLEAAYRGERTLSLENFKSLIDKVPQPVQITFAGFTEPFLAPDCAAMIRYAHEQGHPISLFTTAVGMKFRDVKEIKGLPFGGIQGGFVLHLPDCEGFFTHRLTKEYMSLLTALKSAGIRNFQTMTMGALAPELKDLFPDAIHRKMYSRAGNLKRDDVIQIETRPGPTTCGCQEKLYHSVLLPSGDVSLCCQDYALEHILGNLHQQSFEEIIPENGTCFELCRSCENGVPGVRQ